MNLELCNRYCCQLRPFYHPKKDSYLLIFVSFNMLYLVIIVCYLCFKFSFYRFLNLFSFLSMQNFIIFFAGVQCHVACRILVPQTGVKPRPLAVKVESPNPWTTREFPRILKMYLFSDLIAFFSLYDFCLS